MKIQYALTTMVVAEVLASFHATAGNKKQSSEKEKPNILFCIADDASYAHFSANGSSWVNTPTFDRIAKSGILFTNCYTSNAKSAPSRASILTGLYSWQAREAGNHNPNFPADLKVVTEVLAEQGYDVAFTGKSWAPGNPGNLADGTKRLLTGKPYQKRKLTPPTKGINVNDYAGNFSDFLDENKGGKPWMFWFGATEPHRGYENGTGESLAGKTKAMINDFPAFWPDDAAIRTDMLDYAFEIEYFDRQLERVMAELEKRNMLDNTVIIITSDNGMPFPRCKANNYEYSSHMPLAIMWKKGIKNPGRTVTDYVNFVDFAPTFLELGQINPDKTGMEKFPGRSLQPIFKSSKAGRVDPERSYTLLGRERHDYGRPQNQGYPIRGIIQDNLLYINNLKPELSAAGSPETGYLDVDGSPTKTFILNMKREGKDLKYWELSFGKRKAEELYDLTTDKFCVNNLAENPIFTQRMEAMKALLFAQLKSQNDPRMFGKGDIFDQYPYDEDVTQAWNFWEKVVSGEISKPWKMTNWVRPTDYDAYVKEQKDKAE